MIMFQALTRKLEKTQILSKKSRPFFSKVLFCDKIEESQIVEIHKKTNFQASNFKNNKNLIVSINRIDIILITLSYSSVDKDKCLILFVSYLHGNESYNVYRQLNIYEQKLQIDIIQSPKKI